MCVCVCIFSEYRKFDNDMRVVTDLSYLGEIIIPRLRANVKQYRDGKEEFGNHVRNGEIKLDTTDR